MIDPLSCMAARLRKQVASCLLLACGLVALAWAEDSPVEAASATTAAQAAGGDTAAAPPGPASGDLAATTPRPNKNATLKSAGTVDLGIGLPGIDRKAGDTASAVRIVLGLTLLAIIPSLLVCLTAFLRIVIVLSMLRHAIGMPETPPNAVVIGLALFLTMFTMNPVLQQVNTEALQPFMAGKVGVEQGLEAGMRPLREFMVRQTREQDLALMVELSKSPQPTTIDDIGNLQLIPAFMLSELRAAFTIGFVIFLPFLLIDLIVSSILMSLGMMMMPPVTVAMPIKILMFVLVDGWNVVVKALVGSFH